MPETKICLRPGCEFNKQPQPIDAFPADRTRPDGRHPYCKACRTEQGRERMQRPDAREKQRAAENRYLKSEKGRTAKRAYHVAHMDEFRARKKQYRESPYGKAKEAERRKAYTERHRMREYARAAVLRALKTGRLTKPERCQWCGQAGTTDEMEAHHWRGYEPEYWLDVKFVHARPCHLECESVPPDKWP